MLYGGSNNTNTIRLSGSHHADLPSLQNGSPCRVCWRRAIRPPTATNWKKPVTTYQDYKGTSTLTSASYATLTKSGSRAFYGNYNFLATLKYNFSGHDLKLIPAPSATRTTINT